MTKIEEIRRMRIAKLTLMTKEQIIKMVMDASTFSDTYMLLKDEMRMHLDGAENTIESIDKTFNKG